MPTQDHALLSLARRPALSIASLLLAPWLCGASHALAQGAAKDAGVAGHFGFDGLEVVKVDPNAGPVVSGDFDGDGRDDLLVANNFKSRLELHLQKPNASPDDPVEATTSVNEVPPHWRFKRVEIPVSHQVNAIAPFDFNADGMLDIVYAGQPGTIVFLKQTKPGVFEVERRIPLKGLSTSRDGFVIADLIGDSKPDLGAIVGGNATARSSAMRSSSARANRSSRSSSAISMATGTATSSASRPTTRRRCGCGLRASRNRPAAPSRGSARSGASRCRRCAR
jgi:hypothetical protein